MKNKWEIGIKIFGCFTIISPFSFWIGSLLFSSMPLTKLPQFIINHYTTKPLSLVALLAPIILGLGILRLRKWALKWIFILNWIGAVLGIISLFLPMKYPMMSKIWLIIISVLYVWFFTRPQVKEQFNKVS